MNKKKITKNENKTIATATTKETKETVLPRGLILRQ